MSSILQEAFQRFWRTELMYLVGELEGGPDDVKNHLIRLRKNFEQTADVEIPKIAARAKYEDAPSRFFGHLLSDFWQILLKPLTMEVEKPPEPSTVASSMALEALTPILARARRLCAAAPASDYNVSEGASLLSYAVSSMLGEVFLQPITDAIPFLEWFAEDVLVKRWGVRNPWGAGRDYSGMSVLALNVASERFSPEFLEYLVKDKGCSVDGPTSKGANRSPLFQCFLFGNTVVFNWLLEHGANPLATHKDGHCPGTAMLEYLQYEEAGTVLEEGLLETRTAMLTKVVEEHGLFDGWKGRYNAKQRGLIAEGLADLAVSAYRRNPAYRGQRIASYNPGALRLLDIILSKGFNWSWQENGENALLLALRIGSSKASYLREEDTLALLRRYHAAGFHVGHASKADADAGVYALNLSIAASGAGLVSIVDFAIETVGCPVEAGSMMDGEWATPLVAALKQQNPVLAVRLLERHKAKACYKGRPAFDQPVTSVLSPTTYDDDIAERLLKALIASDPSFLDVDCFKRSPVDFSPFFMCAFGKKPKCLKLLFTSGLDDATLRTVSTATMTTKSLAPAPPLVGAVLGGAWDCLDILLDHTATRLSDVTCRGKPIVEEILRASTGPNPPDRALVAKVLARAKKEKEDGAAARAATIASGATTNAFEDPSINFSSKPLTEKEEKAKAKKKAAKKKAKAKKKSAAKAGAGGAGGAGADESSDDDDGCDGEEEPDDNLVDSRNAPSVDAMFAAMGLGPGGAPLDAGAAGK